MADKTPKRPPKPKKAGTYNPDYNALARDILAEDILAALVALPIEERKKAMNLDK